MRKKPCSNIGAAHICQSNHSAITKTTSHRVNLQNKKYFHLEKIDATVLEKSGYYPIGKKNEFHSYEKEIIISYHKKTVATLYEVYFIKKRPVGSGYSFEPKIRLTSLLKKYWKFRNLPTGSDENLDFYFSETKQDGALILEQSVVIRFNQLKSKGAYLVGTLESDQDESGNFKDIATNFVKKTMTPLELSIGGLNKTSRPPQSLKRLIRSQSKALTPYRNTEISALRRH